MEKIEAVIQQLKNKYQLHTVILYGSRATNDFREDSDYDLLCIRGSGERVREVFDQDGITIDLIVDSEELLERPSEYIYLWSSKVLLDEAGFAEKILARNSEHLKAPAFKLPPNRINQRRKNVLDALKYLELDNALANYRRVDLLSKLLPLYFEIRGEWYLGDKHALNWLEENDHQAASLFQKALATKACSDSIAALANYVITSPKN